MHMKANRSGFALTELMSVTAIIGMVAVAGIPALYNAVKAGQERAARANIASIEKAKGILMLPEFVHQYGLGLSPGAVFGEGEYTEENLMRCLRSVDRLSEFNLRSKVLYPGAIGETAYYKVPDDLDIE